MGIIGRRCPYNRELLGRDHVRGEQLPIDGKIFNDIMDIRLFEYDGEVDLRF